MLNINHGFIGTKVDVCFEFIPDEGGVELRWCQGKVIYISDGYNMLYPNARSRCQRQGEAVNILWDVIDGISDIHDSIQELPKRKWNKQTVGAWRLDADINDKM